MVSRAIESAARGFARRADLSCNESLINTYAELRDANGRDGDQIVFAQSLLAEGRLRCCIRFVRDAHNKRLFKKRMKERKLEREGSR